MIIKKNKFFKNKKILIYGLGKSGLSAKSFLKNSKVDLYDDNFRANNILSNTEIKKKKYDFIVISPGINILKCSLKNFLKKNKQKIITDLDIFYLEYSVRNIIGITGTNGKSTTSKLIYDILLKNKKDVRLVGNFGKPILDEKNIKKSTIFIVEVSSYQLDYSQFFKCNYSILLNISPDHLERHGNLKKYINVKLKILKNQENEGIGLIDNDNRIIKEVVKNKIKSKYFKINSKKRTNKIRGIKNPYFRTKNNQRNLNFVFKLSEILKIKNKSVISAINKFKGLNFRQQIIFDSRNLRIINDSKSTSFSSSIDLIKSYDNVFWIVGGIPKLKDKFNLEKKFFKNINVYICGKNNYFFVKIFNRKLKYQVFSNLNKTIQKIFKDIKINNKKKINVIFSPSAASFDVYRNFEERGKKFNLIIKKFLNKKI